MFEVNVKNVTDKGRGGEEEEEGRRGPAGVWGSDGLTGASQTGSDYSNLESIPTIHVNILSFKPNIIISVLLVECTESQELQYSTMQYSAAQYRTVQNSTEQNSRVQYSTVQYSTVQYSTVQYSTVQCTKSLEPQCR